MTKPPDNSSSKGSSRLDRVARQPYTKGLPEWEMFPDEASRQRAILAIERGMMPRSIVGWIKFVILCAVLFLTPYLVVSIFVDYVLPPFDHHELVKFIAAGVLYTAIVHVLIRRGMPHELRQRLLDAGVPVCTHCGYDLRGLPADRDRCPECGRTLNPRVRELIRTRDQSTENTESTGDTA